MIRGIRLKNWKSHLDSEFRLSEGVNALIGIMGSGKSSVTQAICFALFGTFPALQSKRVTLDDLIMKKPRSKSGCEVELDFSLNGKKYNIKRVVEAGKGTTLAEIREDGRILDETAQAVTRAVEDILQMDYELFSRAVYSEQNGLDYFLRLPKGSRMQQIDEMLKVDRFEDARENTVALANRVKQKREEKMRMVSDLEKEGLDDKISGLEKEITAFGKERAGLQAEVESIRKKKQTMEDRLGSVEAKESELNETKQEIQGVKSGMTEVTKSIEAKKKRLEEFGDVAAKGRQIETEIKELKQKLEKANTDIMKLRDNIASINTEIKLITDSISELEGVKAKCHVCDSPVTEDKKKSIIEGRKAREKELRERASALASDAEKQAAAKDRLEEGLRKRELERERLASALEEAEALKELEARKQAYAKRDASLTKRIGELEKVLKETDIKVLRQEMRDVAAKESEIATRLSGLEERISDKQDILEDLKEREEMLGRYKAEISQDADVIEKLGSFVRVLKMTQEQLREEFLKTVNDIMESIWKELYPYGDFDSVRLDISEGDYLLQLKETAATGPAGKESWVSVDGVASGGERSMACLALRIAFSIAFIPNLKWLILDEPTHNLDSNAITQFSNILRDKIEEFVDQVLLITHEERVSESIGGSLYRLERDKEANEPTRVTSV